MMMSMWMMVHSRSKDLFGTERWKFMLRNVRDTRLGNKPNLQIASDCTGEWQSASKVTLVNKFLISCRR